MTIKEALEVLNPFKACMFDQHGCPISDAAIALNMAISALEKQEAKKPIPCHPDSTWVECPACGDTYIHEYCGKCGQKINWEAVWIQQFDGLHCSKCGYKLQTTMVPNYCPNCYTGMRR